MKQKKFIRIILSFLLVIAIVPFVYGQDGEEVAEISIPEDSEVDMGLINTLLEEVTNAVLGSLTEAPDGAKVAFLGLTYNNCVTQLGELIASNASTMVAISSDRRLRVLSRDKMDILEREWEIWEDYYEDANIENAIQLGLLYGADYLVTGNIFTLGDVAKINLQVIGVEGGVILGGAIYDITLNDALRELLVCAEELIPAVDLPPGSDDFEPDNTTAQATEIDLDGEVIDGLSINPAGDIDYFTFTIEVDSDQYLKVTLETIGTLDTYMVLYGPDSPDYYYEENDDDGTDYNAMISTLLGPGQYWLEVSHYDAETGTGDYSLRAFYEEISADNYEPDDTADEATPLTLGADAQTHSIIPAGDEDWFTIDVEQAGDTESSLLAIQTFGSADTIIYLYGPNDPTLYITEDDDGGDNYSSLIQASVSESGTYYVKVRHYDSEIGVGDYSIAAELTELIQDEYEPNDDPDSATEIPTDATMQTHTINPPSDIDWFTFSLEEASGFAVETYGEMDTVLTVYGPNNSDTFLVEDDDSGEGYNARVEYFDGSADAGTYWIRVSQYNATESGEYQINVELLE
jgi:hypothetical protein